MLVLVVRFDLVICCFCISLLVWFGLLVLLFFFSTFVLSLFLCFLLQSSIVLLLFSFACTPESGCLKSNFTAGEEHL